MESNQGIKEVFINNTTKFYALNEEDYDLDNTSFCICFKDDGRYNKLVFPEWIKNLVIERYKHELDNLPNNLKYLRVHSKLNKKITKLDHLPINLEKLSLMEDMMGESNFNLDYLPENLKYLHIMGEMVECKLDNLPNNLQHLKLFLYDTDVRLESLPQNLKTLELSMKYKYTFTNLPNKLEKLILDSDYAATFTDLPGSLREVVLRNNGSFSEEIKNDVKSLLGDGVMFSYE